MAAYEPYWYQNGQGGIVHWTGNDWRDVILPAIPLSHLYTQQMSYLIHGLEPDRKYEAKVQAKWVPLLYIYLREPPFDGQTNVWEWMKRRVLSVIRPMTFRTICCSFG